MPTPSFALPAPALRGPATDPAPVAVSARARARSIAAVAALGAAATAATLAVASGMAAFELDVVQVLARPAAVAEDVTVQELRNLASLPGPSPLVVAALVPAVGLLLLAGALRRFGAGAPSLRRVSPEALAATERTMAWSLRVVAAGAILVFVAPALLELVGVHTVSLTTGSMAPTHPAGSLLLVTPPGDRGALSAGEIVVIDAGKGSFVTHRVVGVARGVDGRVQGYRTGGDAVPTRDQDVSPPGAITGVVVAGVPVLGAMRAWMASPLGIAIALVLAWALAGTGAIVGDHRRRALAAGAR